MRSIITILVPFLLLIKLTSCQTVKDKTDEIVKKENEKLSKFIGQPESELKILMGNPDSETKDEKVIDYWFIKLKNTAFLV